jgi:CDP-4-dehydro-6-deoxyglucose reductase, E3
MPLPPPFDARLIRARALTPSVRELVFERTDGAAFVFEPGQWVNALLPLPEKDAPETKRSYSIASPPDGSPRFDIAVTRVVGGPGSTWLHAVEVDHLVRFVGPQGFFTRALAPAPPSLMIGTGTGVTPLRSMLRAAITAGSTAPIWLVLGVRREADLLYADELHALAAAHPFVRFFPTLSQPGEHWPGLRGYVQTHVERLWAELASLGAPPHAYVCGLQRMVGSVRDLLRKDMAVPREQVHSERYD